MFFLQKLNKIKKFSSDYWEGQKRPGMPPESTPMRP